MSRVTGTFQPALVSRGKMDGCVPLPRQT